jgi:hypothetical protein
MHPPQFRPTHKLADWPHCIVEVNCCGGSVGYPVQLLIKRKGDMTLKTSSNACIEALREISPGACVPCRRASSHSAIRAGRGLGGGARLAAGNVANTAGSADHSPTARLEMVLITSTASPFRGRRSWSSASKSIRRAEVPLGSSKDERNASASSSAFRGALRSFASTSEIIQLTHASCVCICRPELREQAPAVLILSPSRRERFTGDRQPVIAVGNTQRHISDGPEGFNSVHLRDRESTHLAIAIEWRKMAKRVTSLAS